MLPDVGEWNRRIARVYLPRETMTVKDTVGNQTRRHTVANPVHANDSLARQGLSITLQLSIELVV